MPTAIIILLTYFLGGLVALLVFDLATKGRIRNNMRMAGTQAQIRMAEANNPIGPRAGLMLMLVLTWLFWPMVLIGAVTDKGDEAEQGDKIQRREPTTRYLAKKIWYGECPDCRVILKPDGLLGGSTCPVCKHHFGTIITRRSKNGTSKQIETMETKSTGGGDRAGEAGGEGSEEPGRIGASTTNGGKPDNPPDLEAS